MDERNQLIAELRSQRAALDDLLLRLEDKRIFELLDYQLCECTAMAVEKGLQRIRSRSIDEFVKESLWGSEPGQIVA